MHRFSAALLRGRYRVRPGWAWTIALGALWTCLPSLTLGADAPAAPPAPSTAPTPAAEDDEAEATKAWRALMKFMRQPAQPEAWAQRAPTEEERAEYRKTLGGFAFAAAGKVHEFYTQFPKSKRAEEARHLENQLLQNAVNLGNQSALAQVTALQAGKLSDPNVPEAERAEMRWRMIGEEASRHRSEGAAAMLAIYERGGRAMLQEFPKQPVTYDLLWFVATRSEADQARALARLIDSPQNPSPELRGAASQLLKRLERLGKPLALAFQAVDGRDVDLAKLKGKVVLVDFWATWCGPCMMALPSVKETYQKLHPKGFEIIGISLDVEKDKLTAFLEEQGMSWPQYFDGLQWATRPALEFGVQSIPTMWLVDKKGVLRDVNAVGTLPAKVERLLAEPD